MYQTWDISVFKSIWLYRIGMSPNQTIYLSQKPIVWVLSHGLSPLHTGTQFTCKQSKHLKKCLLHIVVLYYTNCKGNIVCIMLSMKLYHTVCILTLNNLYYVSIVSINVLNIIVFFRPYSITAFSLSFWNELM